MRVGIALIVLAVSSCVGDFEAPEAAECELVVPETVAIGERFEVEVSCVDQPPTWLDYEFGDGAPAVRTSATTREHTYGPEVDDHLWFRVQVFYRGGGSSQRLEARIERRFE